MLARVSMTLLVASCLLAGCGGGPGPSFSVVGLWKCTSAQDAGAQDSVEMKADGTITVTISTGQSASGTWTMSGTNVTVSGLGPTGSETWAINGDTMTNAIGQVCARA